MADHAGCGIDGAARSEAASQSRKPRLNARASRPCNQKGSRPFVDRPITLAASDRGAATFFFSRSHQATSSHCKRPSSFLTRLPTFLMLSHLIHRLEEILSLIDCSHSETEHIAVVRDPALDKTTSGVH